MKPIALAAALFLGLTGTSCEDAARLELRTRGSEFHREAAGVTGANVRIPYTVTNVGDGAGFVPRCDESIVTVIDRWEAAGWQQVSSMYCTTNVMMDPLTLRGGESREGERLGSLEPGRYRLWIGYTRAGRNEEDLRAVSNEFEVR